MTQHTRDAPPSSQNPASVASDTKEVLSQAALLKLSRVGSWDVHFSILTMFYRKFWWVMLPAVATVLYKLWIGDLSGTLGTIAIGVLLGPFLGLTWNILFSKAIKFDTLLEAAYWGCWEEVLNREPKLRGHVPDFDLDFQLAFAWTGLGRFNDALVLLERYQHVPEVPQSLYLNQLAALYELAGHDDEGLAYRRRAYESDVDDADFALKFAAALLTRSTDPDYAKRLIAQADVAPTEGTAWLPRYANGLAALSDGNTEVAVTHFQAAQEILKPWAKARAEARFLIDLMKANQAIALAALGKKSEAQQLFASVRPRIEALKWTLLIGNFERAMAT